jgi:hypothetical protein
MKEIQLKSVNEAESKLEKLAKLISQNATLEEKLQESEGLRRKYQERHMANEEKVKILTENLRAQQDMASSYKKQLNDLKAMKSQNHKIYDEKIQNLQLEVERLKKENDILKKKMTSNIVIQKSQEFDDHVVLEHVEAKPYLFGPVDHGKY